MKLYFISIEGFEFWFLFIKVNISSSSSSVHSDFSKKSFFDNSESTYIFVRFMNNT